MKDKMKKVLAALAKLAPTTTTAHETATLSAIAKEAKMTVDEVVAVLRAAHQHEPSLCAAVPAVLRVETTVKTEKDPKKRTYEAIDPAIQLHQAGVEWLEAQK